MAGTIYHSVEDQAFGCHGCFDRIEIPRAVAQDQDLFVEMREMLEHRHRDMGCLRRMRELEGLTARAVVGR